MRLNLLLPSRESFGIALAASILVATGAMGRTLTWDGDGAADAGGWGLADRWVDNPASPSLTEATSVIFYQTGATNLTNYIGADRIIGGLTVTHNGTGTLTLGRAIGESGGARSLSKEGTGTLIISATPTALRLP